MPCRRCSSGGRRCSRRLQTLLEATAERLPGVGARFESIAQGNAVYERSVADQFAELSTVLFRTDDATLTTALLKPLPTTVTL